MNCGACYKTSTLDEIVKNNNRCPYCGNAAPAGAADIINFFESWIRRK